jgi:phosphoribosylformylglycinamidine cyclo-ligase
MEPPAGLTYRDSGVDIDAGDALVERIKPLARRTLRPEVLAGIGGFGALVEVSKKYRNPVLVAGTDGVGTKLKLAFLLARHDTVGIDLVAMSVNDVLVQGAEPIFFLDYFACGKLDLEVATQVVGGIARGCELAGCALIGGETAEMPGMYPAGEYDLAGFAVGIVERDSVITGERISEGDTVLGIASSGPHSNGYSLIRRILEAHQIDLHQDFLGQPLGQVLLSPTRIYVKPVLGLRSLVEIKGLAHITGGGLLENVPRILPATLKAELDSNAWPRPPIFDWLQRQGDIASHEMHRVFNCGIGMAVVVERPRSAAALAALRAQGEQAFEIGRIVRRAGDEPQATVR